MSTAVQHETPTTHERRFTLRHVSLVLLVIGLLITGYLSYAHLTETNVVCVQNSTTFDCADVNSSIYSEFMGIYVGYLGLLADIFMFAVLLLEPRVDLLRAYGVVLVFAVVLLGWLYHDYLTYVSITRIGKLCPWCLTEHAIMTLLLIVTGVRLYRVLFSGEEAPEA